MTFDALEGALGELLANGEISADQAESIRERYMAHLSPVATSSTEMASLEVVSPQRARRALLGEVGGYVGGGFTLVATLIILGGSWSSLNEIGRSITLAALMVIFAVVGTMLRRGEPSEVRTRLAGTLYAFAAIAGAGTAGVAAPSQEAVAASLVGFVIALLFYRVNRSAVGHVALFGFTLFLVFALLNMRNIFDGMVPGIAFSLVAIGWYFLTIKVFASEPLLGLSLASATAFFSAEISFISGSRLVAYAFFLLWSVAGYLLYSKSRKWPLLVLAVAASTVGVGQLVAETLGGALGVSIGLLAAGLALLAASTYILRNRKKVD